MLANLIRVIGKGWSAHASSALSDTVHVQVMHQLVQGQNEE